MEKRTKAQEFIINQSVLSDIEKYLSEYDRVLVFDNRKIPVMEFLEKLADYIRETPIRKKILLLSVQKIGAGNSLSYKQISSENYEMLFALYTMYEFSDRIQFVTDDIAYGSLFHYLETGVITEKELFEALLH